MSKSIRQWATDFAELLDSKNTWDDIELVCDGEGEPFYLNKIQMTSMVAQKGYETYLTSIEPNPKQLPSKLADLILFTLATANKMDINIVEAITDRWNEVK